MWCFRERLGFPISVLIGFQGEFVWVGGLVMAIKVLWASRHEMTQGQKHDLEVLLQCEGEFIIETRNLLWQATEDEEADYSANKEMWRKLRYEENFEYVMGVFPPVALAPILGGLQYKLISGSGKWQFPLIFTPISAQTAEERSDGTRQIVFRHLRWQQLA